MMKKGLLSIAALTFGTMFVVPQARADMEAIDPSFDINKTLPGVARVTDMGDIGVFENYRYVSCGQHRNARIYVPENYDPQRPIGIMFGFHGYRGETVSHPTLSDLREVEPFAAEEYFITIALATRYRPEVDGWKGGWNHYQNGMENPDARAVFELMQTLKAHYNIDENRIFASGHSNGAGFLGGVAHNLPNAFAVMSPKNPVCGEYQPAFNNTYASIGFGGVFDRFGTAREVREMNRNISNAPIEADFYVFGTDHQPHAPDDDNVDPPLTFDQKRFEFFRQHPRHYQYYGFEPEESAPFFADNLDDEEATRLSSKHWRVDTFDAEGILGNQAGYALHIVNGRLVNRPFVAPEVDTSEKVRETKLKILDDGSLQQTVVYGDGEETTVHPQPDLSHTPLGGLAHTLFYTEQKVNFGLEFVIEEYGIDSRIIPLMIADTRGRVHALVITQGQYQWQTYPTHRHFRVGHLASLERPGYAVDDYKLPDPILSASGDAPLTLGLPYAVSLQRKGGEFSWSIREVYSNKQVAGGVESLSADDSYQFGMGVTGAEVKVGFDNMYVQGE